MFINQELSKYLCKSSSSSSLTTLPPTAIGTTTLSEISSSEFRATTTYSVSLLTGKTFLCQADFSSIGAGVLKSDAKSPNLLRTLHALSFTNLKIPTLPCLEFLIQGPRKLQVFAGGSIACIKCIQSLHVNC